MQVTLIFVCFYHSNTLLSNKQSLFLTDPCFYHSTTLPSNKQSLSLNRLTNCASLWTESWRSLDQLLHGQEKDIPVYMYCTGTPFIIPSPHVTLMHPHLSYHIHTKHRWNTVRKGQCVCASQGVCECISARRYLPLSQALILLSYLAISTTIPSRN